MLLSKKQASSMHILLRCKHIPAAERGWGAHTESKALWLAEV